MVCFIEPIVLTNLKKALRTITGKKGEIVSVLKLKDTYNQFYVAWIWPKYANTIKEVYSNISKQCGIVLAGDGFMNRLTFITLKRPPTLLAK